MAIVSFTNLTPTAKHDLLITKHYNSTSPALLFTSQSQIVTYLQSYHPSQQELSKSSTWTKIATVYTYKEDSPSTLLSHKLEILGFCTLDIAQDFIDHILQSSSSSSSKTVHTCHLGVKRIDGSNQSMHSSEAIQNSSSFTTFVKDELFLCQLVEAGGDLQQQQQQQQSKAAIFTCGKDRYGILVSTRTRLRVDQHHHNYNKTEKDGWEYFATGYIIYWKDISKMIYPTIDTHTITSTTNTESKNRLSNMNPNEAETRTKSETGLWKPPTEHDVYPSSLTHYNFDSLHNVASSATHSTSTRECDSKKRSRSSSHDENENELSHVKTKSSLFHSDTGAAAADEFYSKLTRSLDTRSMSLLFHMRNFNGWVKACQISELNPHTYLTYKSKTTTVNNKKSNANVRLSTHHQLRVLDLACGKGGDLGKWVLHERGIKNYVGIDVARGSLRDAALRARSMRDSSTLKCSCTFICADLGADSLRPSRPNKEQEEVCTITAMDQNIQDRSVTNSTANPKLLSWSIESEPRDDKNEPRFAFVELGGIQPTDTFDVVSIQFAIHYMMSTRQRARKFFSTVSDMLDIGGNLIATTIDARVVMEYIMASGYNFHFDDSSEEQDEFLTVAVGNGACRLKFHKDIIKKIFKCRDHRSLSIEDDFFGLEYTFTLVEGDDHGAGVGEAVDLPEWLIPIPILELLADEVGLKLEYAQNFHDFYSNRKIPSTHVKAHSALYNMKVLNRNGTISDQEWEISRLYIALKFTKIRNTTIDANVTSEEEVGENEIINNARSNLNDHHNVAVTEALKAKLLPVAMAKARTQLGDQTWLSLSSGEKMQRTQEELQKLLSAE